jgi:hypothetical protein
VKSWQNLFEQLIFTIRNEELECKADPFREVGTSGRGKGERIE